MSKMHLLTKPQIYIPVLATGFLAAVVALPKLWTGGRDEVKQTFSQASRADQLASIKKGHVFVACIDKGTGLEETVKPNTTDDLEGFYAAGCKAKRMSGGGDIYELPTGYYSSSPR